jgi:hypothetical protein
MEKGKKKKKLEKALGHGSRVRKESFFFKKKKLKI